MKRSCPGHSKLLHLAALLKLEEWMAAGLLEYLWHTTAKQAPRGDIGKLTNLHLALAMRYRRDPDKMVEALVTAGWIEENKELRLVIHDWHDHADDAVRKHLERNNLTFWNGASPRGNVATNGKISPTAARNGEKEGRRVAPVSRQRRDMSSLPEPEPEPGPEPTHPPTPSGGEGAGDSSVSEKELEDLHDQPELRGLTLEQWVAAKKCRPGIKITPTVLEEIRRAAMMQGHVRAPGAFVDGVLSRMELKKLEEKKERPHVWATPIGG